MANLKKKIALDDANSNEEAIAQPAKRVRRTPAMVKALKAYNFAIQQEDRYLGSVFVTPSGQRDHEAKVKAAYDACKRLGMTHEHGL